MALPKTVQPTKISRPQGLNALAQFAANLAGMGQGGDLVAQAFLHAMATSPERQKLARLIPEQRLLLAPNV